jgi:hypothetical protein
MDLKKSSVLIKRIKELDVKLQNEKQIIRKKNQNLSPLDYNMLFEDV